MHAMAMPIDAFCGIVCFALAMHIYTRYTRHEISPRILTFKKKKKNIYIYFFKFFLNIFF